MTYGSKQQTTFEERCKIVLDTGKHSLVRMVSELKQIMIDLKREIVRDDERFEDCVKENKVQEMLKANKHKEQLIMFSRERAKVKIQDEQYRLKRLRHEHYDQLLFMVFRYWSAKVVEVLLTSKRNFNTTFGAGRDRDAQRANHAGGQPATFGSTNLPQFEVSICFSEAGVLDSVPTMEDHWASFEKAFDNMEQVVFRNQALQNFVHDLNDLFFFKSSPYTRGIFEHMQAVVQMNAGYQLHHQQIFEALRGDTRDCREFIESLAPLQEIHDFCLNWNSQGGGDRSSFEMGFYKETWKKLEEFDLLIRTKVPSTQRVGSILMETNTLQKQLTEMPKQVSESIKMNVTQTMEQETKVLREELGKTSEVLEQLPTSLNTYVEQVNVLKYIDHKRGDFDAQFKNIEALSLQCKQDAIKVSLNLQMAIDEVKSLYRGLPALEQTAKEQLSQNKETMERIMKSSSSVLSKKIKAFQARYVETYLHDKSRLDDCGDTLEELFKRSKAVHEIRSKVILYREFLKLLYENDPDSEAKVAKNKLSCAEDFEQLQDIHKHTIRLWKILLYWKKRRQMCYNTPFLQLDTDLIIKSIHKVIKYLEEKLKLQKRVFQHSEAICKIVCQQVKETSMILQFVKDLRRDSLQNRHWMQIFDLIKAPHLKSQTKFTIVDLRSHNIQNYKEEIRQIIDHANTESKYETIFK